MSDAHGSTTNTTRSLPGVEADWLFRERSFLAADFICGTGYGIILMLYLFCAQYLWKTRKQRTQSLYNLAYLTVLLVLETIYQATQSRIMQLMFVDNRTFVDGPWGYWHSIHSTPLMILYYVTYFLLTFFGNLLIVWRCWVIWASAGRSWVAYSVIALPIMMIMASFGLGILWTYQLARLNIAPDPHIRDYGLAYYNLSLSVNCVVSCFIVIRLLRHRAKMTRYLPSDGTDHYLSLATIVVESAFVYTVFAITCLISYALNSPLNELFLNIASLTQQICNYMIFYRVAQGRAWRKDTISGTQLRFGSSNNSSGGPIQSMPSLRRTDKYGGSASDHGAMSKEVYDSWHPRKSEV